jgi:hypothetical protein
MGWSLRPPAIFLAIIGLVIPIPRTLAAPQTFNTALPVAEDEFIFREQLFFRSVGDDVSAADREIEVLGSVSVLGYGISSNFAAFIVLPYLDKEMRVTTIGGQRVTRKTDGFGDLRLFGRYTVYRSDALGRTFRVAPFLGVELPTGDHEDVDRLGILPAPLQLGSGSWDAFGGIVLTYQTLDYQIDIQASYKANSKANGFRFGDEAKLDTSLQYRLWPRDLSTGLPGFLYGVVEGNLISREKNEIAGARDSGSGGTSFFLSPGIQYVARRWIVEAIIQLPLFQELGGTALSDDFVVRTGFRFNF